MSIKNRIKRMAMTILYFSTNLHSDNYKNEPVETITVDLMADLMHFCHNKKIDFWAVLKTAENHFREEKRC